MESQTVTYYLARLYVVALLVGVVGLGLLAVARWVLAPETNVVVFQFEGAPTFGWVLPLDVGRFTSVARWGALAGYAGVAALLVGRWYLGRE